MNGDHAVSVSTVAGDRSAYLSRDLLYTSDNGMLSSSELRCAAQLLRIPTSRLDRGADLRTNIAQFIFGGVRRRRS
jgi:hypothetical protein